MKLISLNAWGGRVEEILDFFGKHQEVDIFLLQEIFHNGTERTVFNERERAKLFMEISESLPDHLGYFAPVEAGEWGLAIFIKRSIQVLENGDFFVYRERDSMIGRDATTVGRNLQFIVAVLNGKTFNILNFHGLWSGHGKLDSPERLGQSEKIINFIKSLSGEIILAGDFNLRPDTQSLNLIEQELNLKNLVKEYKLESTRTSYYEKPEKFADYVLCSSDIAVKDFLALPEEVSDHKALLLEFV
ncbi:MAG: endonuclease/exonuclease/phosphatase family protein [Patescibacteria group bacterium]